MDKDEKILLRRQIVRVMFSTTPCPDVPVGACVNCMAADVADAIEPMIDAAALTT